MAILATVFGILGNLIATGLFLSPIPTFIRICKGRSTEKFSWVPYVVTLTNCLLWVWYGLRWVNMNIPVLTINAIGAFLQFSYVSIFLAYAPSKKRVKIVPSLVAILVLVASVIAVTVSVWHQGDRSRKVFVGVLCVLFTTGMNVAPLSVMRLVITSKSVEFMPFYLSLFVFANGCVWLVYGLLTSDIFVIIPNGLGAGLGAMQLILYAIYRHATPKQAQEKSKPTPDTESQ